jgi:uncharacterized protein YkwD
LKVILFLFFIVAAASSCSKKIHSTSPQVRTAAYREKVISISNMNADIINDVNAYRQSKGLPAMHLLAIAASEALRHSQDMAAKKISFGHAGFKQRAIAIANELNGTSSTGENIAYGKMTSQEVLAAWLKNAAHRANIEGPFNYTGVGVAKDNKGVVYYTQLFAKK